jgi:YD repeat-containing protein
MKRPTLVPPMASRSSVEAAPPVVIDSWQAAQRPTIIQSRNCRPPIGRMNMRLTLPTIGEDRMVTAPVLADFDCFIVDIRGAMVDRSRARHRKMPIRFLIAFTALSSIANASGQNAIAPLAGWASAWGGLFRDAQSACNYVGRVVHPNPPLTASFAFNATPVNPVDWCRDDSTGFWQQTSFNQYCPPGYQPQSFYLGQGWGGAPPGWSTGFWGGQAMYCLFVGIDPQKNMGPCCSNANVGNPINVAVRNKFLVETDSTAAAPRLMVAIARTYNSGAAVDNIGTSPIAVPRLFGRHWSSRFDTRVVLWTWGSYQTAWVSRGDGRVFGFTLIGATWTSQSDVTDRLVQTKDANGQPAGWVYYASSSDDFETYDVNGNLTSIAGREGGSLSISYDTQGMLARISDTFGRTFTATMGANGLLSALSDPMGQVTRYQYDAAGNLTEVDYPGNGARKYVYENVAWPHALTGVIDENGDRHATYGYASDGSALSTELAGGVGKWTLSGSGSGLTDPIGNRITFGIQSIQGVAKRTSSTQPCSSCSEPNARTLAYDANGNVSSRVDFNNNQTCYVYDTARNLELARVEGALSTETCSSVLGKLPTRADVRKISTEWHGVWRLPTRVAEPNRITTITYNGEGGVLCAPATALAGGVPIGVLCSKKVQPTLDTTGQQAFSATVTGTARTWQYTYDSYGQLLTATDPNGQTTTTTYYAATDPDIGKRGNVRTISNALGHVTTFTAYDANGRPTSITDPNGVMTTLAYHPRGWLISRTVGGETTSYTHDPAGQVTRVTQPDGSYVQYSYDAAHRLTQIQDGLGNRINYTLDAMGNRILEQAFDPSGALARTKGQVFDNLNRLHQSVGAY